ncbi:calcium-binding protein [Shimia thalassica]|uniref:calcium-binding protein n=1 Tax=Shimia thalassica TaxID=1715693 RepID=UPI00249511BE|nr:calcium-binding protein [Shimia thalassica]
MSFSIEPLYGTDDFGRVYADQGHFRSYRVDDNAVVVGADGGTLYIRAFDDDGPVFDTQQFADHGSVGFGEVIVYHIHDNRDGSMNVYYQVRDADPLPAQLTNWVVTLDTETGLETGPATELTTGIFGDNTMSMLDNAWSLPNGNIAAAINGTFVVADPDGNIVGQTQSALTSAPHGVNWLNDLAVVDDQLAVAYASHRAGAANEVFLRFFNMDGSANGDVITVSEAPSNSFGVFATAQIETLTNGNLVVTWTDAGTQPEDPNDGSAWFRIYSSTGTEIVGPTLINSITTGSQTRPIPVATETGFIVSYVDFEITSPFRNHGVIHEYDLNGNFVGSEVGGTTPGGMSAVRVDNNNAMFIGSSVFEVNLDGEDTSLDPALPDPIRFLTGAETADLLEGGNNNDRLTGLGGDDTLIGNDGGDTLIGGDGNDDLRGGATEDDIRDVLYGGAGDDRIDGGYGNDELRGDAGNDTLSGGFGADTVIGGSGHDTLTGSAFADQVFGGDGDDFINGGFGHDLLNGGAGADRFYHIGIADHGSDWVQDYEAASGDLLVFGNGTATSSQFQVNTTHTATAAGERSGDDDVEEAFIIYRPTGQIMWALVDGAGQSEINLQIAGQVYDLLA